MSPTPPYCPSRIPPSPQTSLPEAFSGQISLNGSEDRNRNKKQCLSIFFYFGFYWKRDARNLEVMKSKGLLEPAHSCYGLGLHWFLGLAEYWYGWIRFMWTFKTFGINFLLFLGSCVIRKLVHSSWWELEKSLGWRWDGQRSLGRLRPQLAAIYLITLTAAVIIY